LYIQDEHRNVSQPSIAVLGLLAIALNAASNYYTMRRCVWISEAIAL